MASDFLTAYADLPSQQQRKVSSMLGKLEADATSRGLNLERVRRALGPNIRSLRLGKGYRAIVQQPPRGNQFLLLWAAKHDDAYEWAARHRCDVNPETGAIQLYRPAAAPPSKAE